jgi:hypothetical protein
MGFYARALLRDPHDFGLAGLVDFARERGLAVRVEPALAITDATWQEAELWAPDAEVPVEIDVSRRRDPESLLHDEIEEFEETLADAEERAPNGTDRVLRHLAATDAIVAVRTLASDERHGPAVAQCVLDWYAQRDDVLFQVDADGFYDGDVLLVEAT